MIMAHSIPRSPARESRGNGALPVVLFLVVALAISMFAIGYLAWTAPQRLTGETLELKIPKAPSPAPMPNPQPLPSPLPRPG